MLSNRETVTETRREIEKYFAKSILSFTRWRNSNWFQVDTINREEEQRQQPLFTVV